ncbi:MAG: DUF433 domain-containing protein [Spirosomataceae bacterium]|jgi:uncharacterized protein (DUF433 family)
MGKRTTILPDVCNKKPTIRGMGITVATVIEFLLARESWEIILENYPFLETADIEACIEYTLGVMNRRYTIPLITA